MAKIETSKFDTSSGKAVFLALLSGFASSIGFGLLSPLFSLRMDDIGLSKSDIGLCATIIGFAPLFLTPFVPSLIAKISLKTTLFVSLIGSVILYFALLFANGAVEWTIIRFFFSTLGTFMFVASETWLMEIVPEKYRGRILGLYAAIFYGGIGIGGFLIAHFKYTSNMSLIWAMGISILAIPFYLLKTQNATPPNPDSSGFDNILKALIKYWPLFIPALAIGAIETAAFALLPLWARIEGLGDNFASLILGYGAIGNIALAAFIGLLADKMGQKFTIILISILTFILPFLFIPFEHTQFLVLLIALWSGLVTGFYTMGLLGISQNFSASLLVVANAAFGLSYCIGQFGAPALAGFIMDKTHVNSLMLIFSVLAILPFISVIGRKKQHLILTL